MNILNKFLVMLFVLSSSLTIAHNSNLKIQVSFDNLFPETQFEYTHKICCQLYEQVDAFQFNNKRLEDELNNLFNTLIVLNFSLLSMPNNTILNNNKNILPEDLVYLVDFLDNTKKLYNQKTNNSGSSKAHSITFLFEEAKNKLNNIYQA